MITETPIVENPTEETESVAEKYGNDYIAKSAGEKYGEDYISRTSNKNVPLSTEEQIDQEIEEAGEMAMVSPLDPDFLCFALPLALLSDLIVITLTILAIITIPLSLGLSIAALLAISTVVDVITAVPLGFWIYWRTNRIAKTKEERKKEIEDSLQKKSQILERESLEEAEKNTARLAARESTEEASKIAAKTAAKTAGKTVSRSGTKIFLRTGLRFILKRTIVLGLIPFWTISVLETLKEK